MGKEDIRWKQRFSNYCKALSLLNEGVKLTEERGLKELEKLGLIQVFEFTHELAWKVLNDFYEEQGETGLQGSRDTLRLAFNRGMIDDGEIWMDMIQSRNQSLHAYNEETAQEIINAVTENYNNEFISLKNKLEEMVGDKNELNTDSKIVLLKKSHVFLATIRKLPRLFYMVPAPKVIIKMVPILTLFFMVIP